MLRDPVGPSFVASATPDWREPGPSTHQAAVHETVSARPPQVPPGPWPPQSIRVEQIVFEGLGSFERALRDPARTSISLGEAVLELRAAQERESSSVRIATQILEARNLLIHDLLVNLEAESVKLMVVESDVSVGRILAAKAALERLGREEAGPVDKGKGKGKEEDEDEGEDEAEGSMRGAAASD